MAAATYSIQYTDSKGKTQTLKGVTDVKAMESHIKSTGGTDIVVVKGAKPSSSTPPMSDPNPDVEDESSEPVDDPTEEAAEADPAPADTNAPAPAKGKVPAGLAKYLAAKKAGGK